MKWDNKKLYKALCFATKKHKNQQLKHPKDVPYSAHLCAVLTNAIKYASELKEDINWDLLVCSALLHDTIEDTETTYEEILSEFSKDVADAVLSLTKNNDIPHNNRIKDSIDRIKKQPKEVAIVKMSDRLFNMHIRIPFWSEEKSREYAEEAKLICDELGYACEPLRVELKNYIKNY
ncbi:MAG: bifunctional (p)ppGpp synthetase/guanosine-3',5'-bis(diphosphate) 3'-pyrophosphohydrolase [Clostridia bacterium]|nr:bifunctional (p)ppGpp synthetase/guanosine-3',5'-bis(diphosphate) 3'-pyrophosphohydrolase [Clostridia bacterium]